MPPRPGFIVKNAVDVGANLDIAEPDALDYNLLGSQRYGVISGCKVTVTGTSTITVEQGVYVIDGQVVAGGGQFGLPSSSQQPRFDLIVGYSDKVDFVQGVSSPNPVFPDYDDKCTVFAAVMVRPGITPLQQTDVTDKRIMLMERFVTAITNSGPLLSNQDPTVGQTLKTLFKIDPDGKTWWQSDTALERSVAQTLHVTQNLDVANILSVVTALIAGNLVAQGTLTGSNFRQGTVDPAGTATPGDVYKNVATGTIWVYQSGSWKQLSTVPIPAGMTMTSFLPAAPPGWLLCDGSTRSRADVGGLWDAFPSWRAGPDTMLLPDAKGRFFAYGEPGSKGGNNNGQVAIKTENMPAHKHLTSPTTGAGGTHTHTTTQQPAGAHHHLTVKDGYYGGAHVHYISDPGHVHYASDEPNVGAIICTYYGGLNKLDGLFNDASHTYNVEPVNGVRMAKTGITQTDMSPANHQHITEDATNHTHGLTINAGGDTHQHPITEVSVGGNVPLDIRPPFIGQYLYIKI